MYGYKTVWHDAYFIEGGKVYRKGTEYDLTPSCFLHDPPEDVFEVVSPPDMTTDVWAYLVKNVGHLIETLDASYQEVK